MIIKIDHKKIEISQEIKNIFQHSYKVEAKLLNAIDFPPLKRTISQFTNSKNDFFAYYINKNIVGLVEVKIMNNSVHIQSLVVYPKFFRRGIGRSLVKFVLKNFNPNLFTVETGIDNEPAKKLYLNCGFEKYDQYKTDHSIIKVKFMKRNKI